MGRIKTKLIKRITNQLVARHGDKLKDTYDANKPIVADYTDVRSKKLRNIIAGYATRIVKSRR